MSSTLSAASQNHSQMDSSSTQNAGDKGKGIALPDEVTIPGSGKRKETPSGGSSQSQTTKPKKVFSSRSSHWEHFTKEDPNKCNCNYCGKPLSCPTKQGTSVLINHLKTCKKHKTWQEGQCGTQPVINGDGQLVTCKVSEKVYREASNEMMVLAELPLSFVDSLPWRYFSDKIKMYNPHSRRIATRDIVRMYRDKKVELMSLITTNKRRVSLTTDIWKCEGTSESYMIVTCHYIDANYKLQKYPIAFKNVSDHKGQTIADILLEVCLDWETDKVFTIIVDNATVNTFTIKNFHSEFEKKSPEAFVLGGNHLHMRCAAHIINLIAREGLSEIGDSVDAIRNTVCYLRGSTNRMKTFALKLDRERVSHGSLPMNVSTRWNAIFLMLSREIQFRVGFNKMEEEDKLYNNM